VISALQASDIHFAPVEDAGPRDASLFSVPSAHDSPKKSLLFPRAVLLWIRLIEILTKSGEKLMKKGENREKTPGIRVFSPRFEAKA
jgi:hypothetical protein